MQLSGDYSWAYFNLGQIFYEKGDVENAVIMLNLTVEKNPKDKEAYKLLVQLYLKLNDLETAAAVLDEMKENLGENGDFYFLYSKIYELKEDLTKYKKCLEMALNNEETLSFDKFAVMKELRDCPEIAEEESDDDFDEDLDEDLDEDEDV